MVRSAETRRSHANTPLYWRVLIVAVAFSLISLYFAYADPSMRTPAPQHVVSLSRPPVTLYQLFANLTGDITLSNPLLATARILVSGLPEHTHAAIHANSTVRPLFFALMSSIVFNPKHNNEDSGLTVRLEALRALMPPLQYDPNAVTGAVLVEPRCVPHLQRVVLNHMSVLLAELQWNLHVWTLPDEYRCFVDALAPLGAIVMHNITDFIAIDVIDGRQRMIVDDYNALLKSKSFWESFTEEHLLIFQTDTALCRAGIQRFLSYDYVGAPWSPGQREHTPQLRGGNGGLSLRRRGAMLAALDVHNYEIAAWRRLFCVAVAASSADAVQRNITSDSFSPLTLPHVAITAEMLREPWTQKYCETATGSSKYFYIEDMFFSHAVSLIGGKVARYEDAIDFSWETTRGLEYPVGTHKFRCTASMCTAAMLQSAKLPAALRRQVVFMSQHIAAAVDREWNATKAAVFIPTMR